MSSSWNAWGQHWNLVLERLAIEAMRDADAGHDIDHVRRVLCNATRLSTIEKARAEIVLPAVWLHDCVAVAKNSPQRSMASRLAADRAIELLGTVLYPTEYYDEIHHAITAHSFSAAIACESLEAKVVQDADRLEALGAIGIARCLMTGGSMRQRLYDPTEPFPIHREALDAQQSVDHFFAKLLLLAQTMQTSAGRLEADRRTEFLLRFLDQLRDELGVPMLDLQNAIQKAKGFLSNSDHSQGQPCQN